MFKKILLVFFSCFLFGCSDSDIITVPDHMLPKEKMAEVMVDIHILEATLNIHIGNEGKIKADGSPVHINIYNKHQITKEQFEESYTFYTENPELLVEIYQLVLNDLSRLQAEVMNLK
jgi:hypothetical protein